MKKSEFVKELEEIIDMIKAEDDGFEYGGKVIFYKEDDDNYEISVKNIEMDLTVEANTMASMDDRTFACLMMKTIDKMTDQEIYNLTDEQVEKLIVTRCVEEGVRFIDEPPIMKTYDYKPISPSHFFYYLEGLSIAVLDQNDAIKIAKFLSEFDLYRTSYDFVVSNEELCGKLDIINIKHIPMFDTKDKETYKSIKDKNGEIEKEYKDQVDKYKENTKKMCEIRAKIWSKVIDVRRKIDHMNHLKVLFVKEYLPLVDHDTDKAMIFFKKAYDVDDDTERYIREGIKDYPLFNNNID